MSRRILQALAVTAELTGTNFSEAAARVFAADLSKYPEHQVLGALDRCRKELRGRLTLADVLQRIDDGRPGPEEAWAMMPRDEQQSVVWTQEMSAAWGVALPLLNEGDQVAARLAFVERYKQLMQIARDEGIPPKWTPSLGRDPNGRAAALREAVEKHRMLPVQAEALLPGIWDEGGGMLLLAEIQRRATGYTQGVPSPQLEAQLEGSK